MQHRFWGAIGVFCANLLRTALFCTVSLIGLSIAAPAFAQTVKSPEHNRIDNHLGRLFADFQSYRSSGQTAPFQAHSRLLRMTGTHVAIDAAAAGNAQTLLAELQTLGLQHGVFFRHMVSGYLPIEAIAELIDLPGLRFARAVLAGTDSISGNSSTRTGAVVSQGDQAIGAAVARELYGIDGSGVKVGTLSDSFDCLGTADEDIISGDLPADIEVLAEIADCSGAGDEGRAMMQIIADVAPGARQVFYSAFNGQAAFAQGIVELALAANADVIVDDVIYYAEPFFQDGIIAQAVDSAVSQGSAYFSAAGNNARNSYASAFRSGQSFAAGAFQAQAGVPAFAGGVAHDFSSAAAGDYFQRVTVSAGAELVLSLQWVSPYYSASGTAGALNDLDIYLLDDPPGSVLAASTSANIDADPVEVLVYANDSAQPLAANLLIVHHAGPQPDFLKYVNFSGFSVAEHHTASATIVGHQNAKGALAVGAAAYFATPVFGVSPPLLQPSSSEGGTTVRFDLDNNAISELRAKPDIVCSDGGNTTFFGESFADGDNTPNFFGTSAAAPHAAGIAALMLEWAPDSPPEKIYQAMQSTALDMETAGFDFASGYGFCMAEQAVAAASNAVPALGFWALSVLVLFIALVAKSAVKTERRGRRFG